MATKPVSEKYFNAAIKTLESSFGVHFVTKGLADYNPKGIPTGYEDIDSVITRGATGLYKGGIVEIAGSEGSGKSAFCLRTVGNAQKMGLSCAWFDIESSFDAMFAKIQGTDPDKLKIVDLFSKNEDSKDEENIELSNCGKVIQMLYRAVISNAFDLIVVDSVAALIAGRVLEDDYDPDKIGMSTDVSRVLSQNLGKIVQACEATETTVIFINQLRDQPNAYMQNRFHTPGGRALKFFSHQRLGMEKINGQNGKIYIKDEEGDDECIGHYSKITIIKNKKAPPLAEDMIIQVPVYYKEYFPDNAKICYDLGRRLQVISMRQGVLTWKEDKDIIIQANGESDFLAELRNRKLENKLAKCCVKTSKGEKNQSLKIPVRVPPSIAKIAESSEEPTPAETKKKKGMAPALSLETNAT